MSPPQGKKDPAASTSSGDLDLDKILSREASAFQRDVEVERILKAFKLK
jgi:DnaJ family protein C protein 8